MSRSRRGKSDYRDIDGILILDKPEGRSSNWALQQVRRCYHARKAGHCGSLDPFATGLLPICLGQATKFSAYLLDADKSYRATCRLGVRTSTGDTEGEIIATAPVDVEIEQINRVLAGFVGQIEQIPPMYSALKHEGKRLYELARAGQEVERKARSVTITRLDRVEFSGDELVFDVTCSKGTYVRTLAEDIGNELGCGAHLGALRRMAVPPYSLDDAVTLPALQAQSDLGLAQIDALLLPVSGALERFPVMQLSAAEGRDIGHGKVIPASPERAPGVYRLLTENDRFLGLGEVGENGSLSAKRLMNTAR